eukprot:6178750-Pleurochrysis_carterae.AAC.2
MAASFVLLMALTASSVAAHITGTTSWPHHILPSRSLCHPGSACTCHAECVESIHGTCARRAPLAHASPLRARCLRSRTTTPFASRSDAERRELLSQLFGERTAERVVPKADAQSGAEQQVQMLQEGEQLLQWGETRLVDVDMATGPLEVNLQPLLRDSTLRCIRLETPLGMLLEEVRLVDGKDGNSPADETGGDGDGAGAGADAGADGPDGPDGPDGAGGLAGQVAGDAKGRVVDGDAAAGEAAVPAPVPVAVAVVELFDGGSAMRNGLKVGDLVRATVRWLMRAPTWQMHARVRRHADILGIKV